MAVDYKNTRSVWRSLWRGFTSKCPNCREGSMFSGYLKVTEQCQVCGEDLFHHRADDAPPYFTIFIVGHLVLPAALIVEQTWHPGMWTHFLMWFPAVIITTLLLLPRIKGAIVGLQWALGLHGFQQAHPGHLSSTPDA